MELFGIAFSIPVAFVMSMVYCAILTHAVRRREQLRRWLYAVSIVLLLGFLGEVLLLAALGAVGSRAFVGPAFYVAHSVFFFLGAPALANVLLLRKRGPIVRRWYLAGAFCTIFAYGIDGTNAPTVGKVTSRMTWRADRPCRPISADLSGTTGSIGGYLCSPPSRRMERTTCGKPASGP